MWLCQHNLSSTILSYLNLFLITTHTKLRDKTCSFWSSRLNKSSTSSISHSILRYLSYSISLYTFACSSNPMKLSQSTTSKIPIFPKHHNMIRMRTICGVSFDEFARTRDKSGNNYLMKTKLDFDFLEPSMLGIKPETPKWPEREELIRANVERRANSVDLPLSLRMIKKKMKSNEGCIYSDDPIKKIQSLVVFILLELQKYALKMRGSVLEDSFEAVIGHIGREMNDSLSWMFKRIFPQSPNMMICLMTLLADFSVYSLAMENSRLDSSTGVSFSCKNDSVSNSIRSEDCTSVEKRIEDNSNSMNGNKDLSLLLETEEHKYVNYHRTDLQYQENLSGDPSNSLLLCNYAQFLQVVSRDYDRAENFFKRATQVTPPDAEALNRYANFLWIVRNDLAGAEQKYIDAIEVESGNSYYVSSYANFLWNSGAQRR